MSDIKVSVVMPVYNTVDYVADAMSSIINQTLKEIEVIVINDGSTDNSLQIINEYASIDKRICVINQENKGLSESRNEGIRLARGEYIYFMDSDDLLSPDALQACYEKCTPETLDFVFFDASLFGETPRIPVPNYKRPQMVEDKTLSGTDMLGQLLAVNGFLASACLIFINLSYLKRIGLTFYPGIIHEDELFTLQLYLQSARTRFIPKTYFKRRLREGSIMTTKFSQKNIRGYLTVASELIKLKGKSDSEDVRSLIDKRLSGMMPGVLFSSRALNFWGRYYVVSYCLTHYKKYISWKYALLTLFPISRLRKLPAMIIKAPSIKF